MECKEHDCTRKAVARGMCLMHYKRWRRQNRERMYDWQKDEAERFWQYVDKGGAEDCWNWIGLTLHGYGRFSIGSRADNSRRQIQAHRYSYELLVGPIPTEYQLDHLCGNRRCVNPNHLEPVSPKTNILRGSGITAQNARKTHCPHGHEYTPENTIVTKAGSRKCKVCRDARYKRWKGEYDENSEGCT